MGCTGNMDEKTSGEAAKSWPSHGFTGDLREAIILFLNSSMSFVRFTENLPEKGNLVAIEYHAINGTAFKNTIEEVILHVMNHGTYHRGQLITMLRNTGFENVGSTDFIRFLRE